MAVVDGKSHVAFSTGRFAAAWSSTRQHGFCFLPQKGPKSKSLENLWKISGKSLENLWKQDNERDYTLCSDLYITINNDPKRRCLVLWSWWSWGLKMPCVPHPGIFSHFERSTLAFWEAFLAWAKWTNWVCLKMKLKKRTMSLGFE